ncbi:PEP-CTERM protein-sorting domain-containing protein [Candidatus Electrothrix aarhusensis]|uniref:PEP-CTERM protein-sorting domain-containing protein n=1 Tax=Candidatus Electrothrix aarhusensis TaxID=1859131 RepID=A0A444ITW7_9BACT|nr:PEP-CTERM protein-sorting domain-containing protein [Candidatus Electrothrix aarhusensis]
MFFLYIGEGANKLGILTSIIINSLILMNGRKKMKKKLLVSAVFAAGVGMLGGNAMAVSLPFGGDGSGSTLQGVFDDLATDGNNAINVTTDALNDFSDSYWSVGGSGGAVSTMIIELAGFAPDNTFGIFDRADRYNTVQLFGGSSGTGDQTLLSIRDNGDVFLNFANVDTFAANDFGFYLDSSHSSRGGMWYSDTSFNSDGMDHMGAYQGVGEEIQIAPFAAGEWGNNEFILAFEDLGSQYSDQDYTDFVVMVESVNPHSVPEPSAMLLFSTGIAGLIGIRRKKK